MEAGEGLELPTPTQGELLIIYTTLNYAHFLSLQWESDISLIKSTFSLHVFAGWWHPRAARVCLECARTCILCKFGAAWCANLRLAINSSREISRRLIKTRLSLWMRLKLFRVEIYTRLCKCRKINSDSFLLECQKMTLCRKFQHSKHGANY